jgi:hypothetical protein
MKSQHRHQLETNALAKRLDVAVERMRPYASTIAGVVVAVVVVMFLWSYFAGSSSARQSQAWDAYNQVLTEQDPNIDQLRQTAQEHPGTKMQQMADVTWADGQVFVAARDYLYNRPAAMEALSKAMSAYQAVIQSSNDERLVNRARLGVARVYEIQGKLAEAGEAYAAVQGVFAKYAKEQAERLAKPEAKEVYAWLATARPKLPRAPTGPGTPGVQPEFSAGELNLPSDPTAPAAPGGAATQEQSIEELLKGLELDFGTPTGDDRYGPAGSTPAAELPPNESSSESPSTPPVDPANLPPNTTPPADAPSGDTPSEKNAANQSPAPGASADSAPETGDEPK